MVFERIELRIRHLVCLPRLFFGQWLQLFDYVSHRRLSLTLDLNEAVILFNHGERPSVWGSLDEDFLPWGRHPGAPHAIYYPP